ncbi:GNAT family N-acetyltransferase [Salibacterium aidingense]|uniref:GNAT family N-acetyltransferase n=1 Tax=Salibacterium aidingense TaxID=384933 RepID=UPI0004117969|nr:GNAT family N-acetyltransferase [Salibacterium aidingense]
MNHTIKSFTRADIAPCTELYVNVFNAKPWNEEWSYEIAEERLRDLYMTPKFCGLTLYDGKNPAGFIGGNKKQTPQGVVFYIAELCIARPAQGQGAGSVLTDALEEKLRLEKVSGIYLITSRDGPAERFYLKNNYVLNNNRIIMKKNF